MDFDKIPKNIGKRDDIYIKNKYEIIKSGHGDFHSALYYLNNDKCKIIIRRLDEEYGWNFDLKIKIYDELIGDLFEELSVGSSEKNCKIINLNVGLELKPIEIYIQKIPKVIIQTSYNNNIKSLLHYNAVKTFLELNPEYKYEFYDDNECREFIKKNFDSEVLDSFDLLNPGAYKADLFRLCIIFINGGCYFDNKYILRIPLRNLIQKDDLNIFCKDRLPHLMFNSIIFSVKKNVSLKKCIDDIVYNVKTNNFGKCPLYPTGPALLNMHASNENIILEHHCIGDRNISDKNYINCRVILKGQHNSVFVNTYYKGYYGNDHDKNSYTTLYKKKEIYYKNIVKKHNYIFLVYPNQNNDIFDMEIIDGKGGVNSINIKRIDNNTGWGQNLKIKIINNLDNTSKLIEVGSSQNNNIIVSI
jgi:hypothetical protein